jgi:hypothetical protein
MQWINAGNLKYWYQAKARHCQDHLPALVSLLLATDLSATRRDFPSGESVTTGGLDGYFETPTVSTFYSQGISIWEMSSDDSPGQRAEENYIKRTADPHGVDKKEASFIFVTPRPFPDRRKWEAKKRGLGEWKNVRVVAGDELVGWLAEAPAVAKWLAREIGLPATDTIRDIRHEWEIWSSNTNPPLTPEIVISGRVKDVGNIHHWLREPPNVFQLQGDSTEESRAFLYAAIMFLPPVEQLQALSRCIVVQDKDQFVQCAEAFRGLIIVAPAECGSVTGHALKKGHHVFLCMSPESIGSGIVVLSRLRQEELKKALREAGLSDADAQHHARECGRSIQILWRHLSVARIKEPTWADAEFMPTLLPVLLAGAWQDDRDGDRKVIEELAGKPYEEFFKELEILASIEDTPIRRVGNVWMLKSPLDAWFLAARYLNQDYLQKFQQAINTVLTKTDPKYDLPAGKRWAAAMYGKISPYSEWLRKGLVESLVLLAVYGEEYSHSLSSPQGFADVVVKEIFDNARSWEVWASLKDVSPLLAEAAPDAFLDVVEDKVAHDPDIFTELFRDEGSVLGECKHAGLLWALESVGWDPTYFTRTSQVLNALSTIDTGGSWSNRPFNSLKDLLMPGLPQTYAKPSQRITAFDMLAKQDAEMAWKLIEKFLDGGSMSASHKFRWRYPGGERDGLDAESYEDQREYVNDLLPRSSAIARSTPANLARAIEIFLRLPSGMKDDILSALEALKAESLSKDEREHLRAALRHTLNWLNSFGVEEQKTPVPALFRALEALTPTDTIERVNWLFVDAWVRLPEGREDKEFENHRRAMDEARNKAARDLLDTVEIEKILDYGETLEYVGIFSHALATAAQKEKEDAAIVDAMIKRLGKESGLLRGYSTGKVDTAGKEWVSRQLKRIKAQGNYSALACAALYNGLPESVETWTEVHEQGSDVEAAYWRWASGYARPELADGASIAVEKLLDVDRASAALRVAGDPHVSVPTPLLQRLLQAVLSLSAEERRRQDSDSMFEFYLTNVFSQIYERDDLPLEDIAKLEWPFASLFNRYARGDHVPRGLHSTLQKDPGFFAQLISFLYKLDDESEPNREELTEEQKSNLAHNAYEVLNTWSFMPGVGEDGSVDAEVFKQWVTTARERCAEIKLLRGCDLRLAEVFARMPPDPDGIWPHGAVRELIEELKNDTIEKHIPIAIYNRRGVVSRSFAEGGEQERTLASKYKAWSKSLSSKWPRTAKVLRSLAAMYDRDAHREDVESDLNDLRWS